MGFQINTNVSSLQAQEYLRINSDFQSKTISRVTSGLRIVSSGDDAAGLAIANGFRSDQAVLTQGVRNANDGLSQLQIADGGINNISKLLDRARSLATQSASGTFSGDRGVLNSEFQSVISEIDRQAQAIGLDQNGLFAKAMSVFIGGGRANNGTTAIGNGSVGVDLTHSTVDAKSLGLKGVQSTGLANTDIGTGSATTSVAQIVADNTNTTSLKTQGYTDFFISGPGFTGEDKVKVSVNLAGVSDTGTLVTAINNAIDSAGLAGTQAATAFKNANLQATVNTDAAGKKQLSFTSANTSFQVQAGDRLSNALLGNFTSGATGKDLTNTVTAGAPRGLYNDACGLLTLYVYLRDHKAATLSRVVDHVQAFARDNDTADTRFLLAAGSAGIEAATNIVVKDAWRLMLVLVYGAVVLLCFATFRSWRAVLVAVLPLVLTSFLAEALMVALGMGVKVATLPVIALGVGIGVDYALYILSVVLAQLREGKSLSESYYRALLFTGKVVLLTGVTLAAGVITWVLSPIKFQADMGLLLAFMFLWNMLGALVLLPALAHFLLKRTTRTAEDSAAFAGHLQARHSS